MRHFVPVLDGITDTVRGDIIAPDEVALRLEKTRIVFAGETHTNPGAHEVQRRLIEALADTGRQVFIGIEMLPHTLQPVLDDWTAGRLSEPEFLRKAAWYQNWGTSFHLYRDIFVMARDRGIRIFGVNIPRELVTKVRKEGLEKLSKAEAAQLPQTIDLTSREADEHRALFRSYFGDDDSAHGALESMFRGQCTWDAAMAFHAAKAVVNHGGPDAIMVVLIGEGHVAYGLGAQRQAALWFKGETSAVIPYAITDGTSNVRGSLARFIWGTTPEPTSSPFPALGLSLRARPEKPLPLVVGQVMPGSAAERAGVKPDDEALSLDELPLTDKYELPLLMLDRHWGQTVRLHVRRGGRDLRLELPLRRQLDSTAD